MGAGCPGSDGGRELFPGHTYGASKLGHGVRTWWSPHRECQSARNVAGREDKFPQRHWGINAGRQPWEQKWRLQSAGQWCNENLWFRCLQYNSLRHEVLMTHVNLLFIYFFKRMTGKWTSLLLGVSRENYYVESLLIIEKSVHTLQMQAAATVTLLCHRGEKPLHFSRCRRRPVFTPVEWQGWSGTRNVTKRQAPLSRSWQLIEKPDKLEEQRRSALRKRSSALPFWGQGGYARLLPSGPCWICSSHGLLSNTHTTQSLVLHGLVFIFFL